jgi:hypothetical protein
MLLDFQSSAFDRSAICPFNHLRSFTGGGTSRRGSHGSAPITPRQKAWFLPLISEAGTQIYIVTLAEAPALGR